MPGIRHKRAVAACRVMTPRSSAALISARIWMKNLIAADHELAGIERVTGLIRECDRRLALPRIDDG
jgi:hypothetical protein